MTYTSKHGLLTSLAFTGFLLAGPAQACMPGLPFLSDMDRCPSTSSASAPACPASGESGAGCLISQQDVGRAVGAMGTVAAGGLGFAADILRTLSDQASRISESSRGI